MKLYNIYAGLGGGFGGAQHLETLEFEDENAANEYAYELAIEEYRSYEGLHGLADFSDICENPEDYGLDEDFTDEAAEEAYIQEIANWIEYWAEAVE